MAVQEHQDYVFAPSVDVNEGISTGAITKAALLGTRRHIFVIPFNSVAVLGLTTTTTDYGQGHQELAKTVAAMLADPAMSIDQVEQVLRASLDDKPHQRVFPIEVLDVLRVQVGWWVFGGMRMRSQGEGLKVINLQPRAAREAWARFYQSARR